MFSAQYEALTSNAKFVLLSYWLMHGSGEEQLSWKNLARAMVMPYRSFALAMNELISNGMIEAYSAPSGRGRPVRVMNVAKKVTEDLVSVLSQQHSHYHRIYILLARYHHAPKPAEDHLALSIKNRLLLTVLFLLANEHGLVEGVSVKQVSDATGLTDQAIRFQLAKLEKAEFFFSFVQGVKHAPIVSRRPAIYWLNLGHPVFFNFKASSLAFVLNKPIRLNEGVHDEGLQALFSACLFVSTTIDEASKTPVFCHPKLLLKQKERLEQKYQALSAAEGLIELIVALEREEGFYGLDFIDDVFRHRPPSSVFEAPKKQSLVLEMRKRSLFAAFSGQDVLRQLGVIIDYAISNLLTAKLKNSEPIEIGAISEKIMHFLLKRLNTLGPPSHQTAEELAIEREFMQERVGQFCLSLSKSIDAYTGALTSLLKNNNGTHELENIDIVNFRSLSLGQHKAYVHYLPSHYGFSGVIQVVYRRGAVTGGFRNKLLAVREITDINLSGKKIISLQATESMPFGGLQ